MRTEENNFMSFIKTQKSEINLIDVGANICEYVDLVESFNIKIKKGILLEPNSYCIDIIKEKIKNKEYLTLKENLVGANSDDIVDFYEVSGNLNGYCHSSAIYNKFMFNELLEKNYKIEPKPMKKISINDIYNDLFLDERIDILKIDTEGYEFEVLKGCSKLLENKLIDYIQFEYGNCYIDGNVKFNDIINYLKSFDYYVYSFNNNFQIIENYNDDFVHNNYFSSYKKY